MRSLGKTYGLLTLIDYHGRPKGNSIYTARCACGTVKVMTLPTISYRHSCGCTSAPKHPRSLAEAYAKSYQQYKTRARTRKIPFSLTKAQFTNLLSQPCLYCGTPPGLKATTRTPKIGVDRHNNRLGYTADNSAPCCAVCNRAKSDLSMAQFHAWINQLLHHHGHQEP